MRKYEFLLTRILRFDLRFCPYKGAYRLVKNRIFPYFMQCRFAMPFKLGKLELGPYPG